MLCSHGLTLHHGRRTKSQILRLFGVLGSTFEFTETPPELFLAVYDRCVAHSTLSHARTKKGVMGCRWRWLLERSCSGPQINEVQTTSWVAVCVIWCLTNFAFFRQLTAAPHSRGVVLRLGRVDGQPHQNHKLMCMKNTKAIHPLSITSRTSRISKHSVPKYQQNILQQTNIYRLESPGNPGTEGEYYPS